MFIGISGTFDVVGGRQPSKLAIFASSSISAASSSAKSTTWKTLPSSSLNVGALRHRSD
jgi:hypothetical protein